MVAAGKRNLSKLLDLAYRIDLSPNAWHRALDETLLLALKSRAGVVSFEFDASEATGPVRVGTTQMAGEAPRLYEDTPAFHESIDGASYRVIMKDRGVGAVNLTVMSKLAELGLSVRDFPPVVWLWSRAKMADMWSLYVLHGEGRGLGFVHPLSEPTRLDTKAQATWERVGSHILAGYSLRRQLAGKEPLAEASALFRPDGTALDLDEAAHARRDALRHTIRAIDRARAADYRTGEASVLELWDGVVEGRWRLYDHVDTDGARFIVLVPVEPAQARKHRLSTREREVARRVAHGVANKEIACDLDISLASVATYLRRALGKLGLSTRGELQMLWGRIDRTLPRAPN